MSLPTILIRLDLGGRVLEIEQLADLDDVVREAIIERYPNPYWAYLWPSARALALHLARRDDFAGQRVLDLGCGLGAAGLAAATRGARVTLADICADAVDLAGRNARRNELEAEPLVLDWNAPPPELGKFDRILAGDVIYEDGMLAGVLRFIATHLAPEGEALLADPKRIAPSGIQGAARFHGLEVETTPLVEGETMTGGVLLHALRFRGPRARPAK